MSAAFTFDSYKLVEVTYKPVLDSDSTKTDGKSKTSDTEKKNTISLASDIAIGREKANKYRMSLKITVSGTIDAKICLFGFFSGTGFYEDDKTELAELSPIGIALLLPIARSILASISAQDGSTPFMLPTVNVTEMISQTKQDYAEK